jgi:hypothetical protein
MNWLKTPLFIAHFNFANDMSYEGLHELRKSRKIPNPKLEDSSSLTIPLCYAEFIGKTRSKR